MYAVRNAEDHGMQQQHQNIDVRLSTDLDVQH